MIDRDIYFAAVRDVLYGGALTQQQVDGSNVILALWEGNQFGTPMSDIRWLAYMLATTYWETGYRMWPCVEQGSDDYLQGKEYHPYVGRGLVQLTWEDNYRKASSALGLIDDRDLVAHPEVALDSLIAARIMGRGMAEGWFTGKRLSNYFDAGTNDPKNARQIINGNDRDDEIAAFHIEFLEALQAAESDTPVQPQGEVILTVPSGTRVIVNDLVVEP